jgi:hypothetical protein
MTNHEDFKGPTVSPPVTGSFTAYFYTATEAALLNAAQDVLDDFERVGYVATERGSYDSIRALRKLVDEIKNQ